MTREALFTDTRRRFLETGGDNLVFLRLPKETMLYGPHDRAVSCLAMESNFGIEARSRSDGRFCVAELTAVLAIHGETRALARLLANGELAKVREILSLSETDDLWRVIEGASDFVYNLSYAAGIREKLSCGEALAVASKKMSVAIEEDYYLLGQAVCLDLTSVIDDGQKRKGAEIAANLYLVILAEYSRFLRE